MALNTLMMPKYSVRHFAIRGVIHYFKTSGFRRQLPMASHASLLVGVFLTYAHQACTVNLADLHLLNSPSKLQPIAYFE